MSVAGAAAVRVLVIDADGAVGLALAEQLRLQGGFEAETVDCVAAALAALARAPAQALLIDADLPKDGTAGGAEELCRKLRAGGFDGPLLLLGAAGSDCPASTVIPKPVRLGMLVAQLRSQLAAASAATSPGANPAAPEFGPYRLHAAEKRLEDRRDGGTIRLTEKEVAILRYLSAAGEPVDRQRLLHAVWGYNSAVTTHTVETHIYRLRRKIEAEPAEAEVLRTEPDGYCLSSARAG